MLTCNRLDLETLGSQPIIMPKNLPEHWVEKQPVEVTTRLSRKIWIVLEESSMESSTQ